MSSNSNRQYLADAYRSNRDYWKYADASTKKEPIKMLYMNHNMKQNYKSADASGDSTMKSDILMSEIAKLIVNQPEQLEALLFKYGFVPDQVMHSSDALVELVGEGFNKSQKFTTEVVALLAKSPSPALNATGGGVGQLLGDTSSIVGDIGGLFGGKTGTSPKAGTDALKTATAGASGKPAAKSNMGMYIVIALVAATVIGTVIYIATRPAKA